jgi:hypothetical protein
MKREDVLRIARVVNAMYPATNLERLELFAEMALNEEREACAQICDAEASAEGTAQRCAIKIRARR